MLHTSPKLQICPATSIESFNESRSVSDRDYDHRLSTVIKFGDSPHCEHLRYNKELYTEAVHKFVDECTDENGISQKSSSDADDFEKLS